MSPKYAHVTSVYTLRLWNLYVPSVMNLRVQLRMSEFDPDWPMALLLGKECRHVLPA